MQVVRSGVRYVNAAVGGLHTVLLNDNGRAVCFGYNADGQCDAPAPPPGLRYSALAAGGVHT